MGFTLLLLLLISCPPCAPVGRSVIPGLVVTSHPVLVLRRVMSREVAVRLTRRPVLCALADSAGGPSRTLDRLPPPRTGRAIAGIDDRVHHVAILEGLRERCARAQRVDEVLEMADVAVRERLFGHGLDPAGGRWRLLEDVARVPKGEGADPGRARAVGVDRPLTAGDLVTEVDPMAGDPIPPPPVPLPPS